MLIEYMLRVCSLCQAHAKLLTFMGHFWQMRKLSPRKLGTWIMAAELLCDGTGIPTQACLQTPSSAPLPQYPL